jgi:hypothetical protein
MKLKRNNSGFQNPYPKFRFIPFVGLLGRLPTLKDLPCNHLAFGWQIAGL